MSLHRTLAAAAGALALGASAQAAPSAPTAVVELRQYRVAPGGRDAFVKLFDREFVESQEALGARLVGQYRDLDDPNRFVWIRAFAGWTEREKALTDFYSGPVWQRLRNEANSYLLDTDNVLLLKPATPGHGFGPAAPRIDPPKPGGLVVATIYYLWAEPSEGFAAAFDAKARPELEAAGLPVLAAFAPEPTPNNYPRLPVRQGEKVFVWFTRVDSPAAYAAAQKRLAARPALKAALDGYLERAPQVLRLEPTPRSALR